MIKQTAINPSNFDVFGLGHSLVDISVPISTDALITFGVSKGNQSYLNHIQIQRVLHSVSGLEQNVGMGGCTRNTLQGLSLLGSQVDYCSIVGNDQYGQLATENLEHFGISNRLMYNQPMTGVCLVLVTPDGDRTMITYGGDVPPTTILDANLNDIHQSKILHSSGYMLHDPERLKLFESGVSHAFGAGTLISFDLADPVVVKNHKALIMEYIFGGKVDILFGNESEFEELLSLGTVKSIQELQRWVPIIAVKKGSRGATISTRKTQHEITAYPTDVLDTTGAGDIFAAGFLHGLLQQYPIDVCGQLGAFLASDAVAHRGIQLSDDITNTMAQITAELLKPDRFALNKNETCMFHEMIGSIGLILNIEN